MDKIQQITQRIIDFRERRDWKQFHNPKDLALSLVLESAELMEHFQWKNKDEMEKHLIDKKEAVAEEMADVLYWILLMGHDFDIDVFEALEDKIKKNEQKYPEDKAKGSHKKYTEL
jgi:NTP pyrophosphatase (non-canonical NTP hydrolase)